MKAIKCSNCGELGTIVVDLFTSGYLVALGDGTTDIRESESGLGADDHAECYACGKQYSPSEYEDLVVEVEDEVEKGNKI